MKFGTLASGTTFSSPDIARPVVEWRRTPGQKPVDRNLRLDRRSSAASEMFLVSANRRLPITLPV